MRQSWIQLKSFKKANTLLILPCNAAACIGDYFQAEYYSKRKWNTWREVDAQLHDLRQKSELALAAVDSVTLETQPDDDRGAIVLETEMDRVKNDTGEDWGAPCWKWFRPTRSGKWNYLQELTDALVKGVRRVESLGFSQVFTLVNPRGYFLALAAAVHQCNLADQWVNFRVPAHPKYLLEGVRQIAPIIRSAHQGRKVQGGIYPVPKFYSALLQESKLYKNELPAPWKKCNYLPGIRQVNAQWLAQFSR